MVAARVELRCRGGDVILPRPHLLRARPPTSRGFHRTGDASLERPAPPGPPAAPHRSPARLPRPPTTQPASPTDDSLLEKAAATPRGCSQKPLPPRLRQSPRVRLTCLRTEIMLLGCDLGIEQVLRAGRARPLARTSPSAKVVPTLVGYVKDGIVDGIIAGNARTLFGEARRWQHAARAAGRPAGRRRDCRPGGRAGFPPPRASLIDPKRVQAEIRAVVGIPAGPAARDDIQAAAPTGIFQRVLLIPEPFLAALGYRDVPASASPTTSILWSTRCSSTSAAAIKATSASCRLFSHRRDQISVPFCRRRDRTPRSRRVGPRPSEQRSRHKVPRSARRTGYVGPPASRSR